LNVNSVERTLQELHAVLTRVGTQELHLLADGSVWWVGSEGLRPIEHQCTYSLRNRLASFIADQAGVEIHAMAPILSVMVTVFGEPWRVTAFHPPVTKEMTLTLRRLSKSPIPLSHYVETGRLSVGGAERLLEALAGGERILVFGANRSGKTTFATALLQHYLDLHPNTSLTVIEDTPEIRLRSGCVRTLTTAPYASVDFAALVTAALRTGASRIVLGEIRDSAATGALLNAYRSGHGGLTTFHAGDARQALFRLRDLAGYDRLAPIAAALPIFVHMVETYVEAIHHVTERQDGDASIATLYDRKENP
jgi:type IV secretion system protein VirB11